MNVKVGDVVKWSRARTLLGTVVHLFSYEERRYAVVKRREALVVVRIYEDLVVVK